MRRSGLKLNSEAPRDHVTRQHVIAHYCNHFGLWRSAATLNKPQPITEKTPPTSAEAVPAEYCTHRSGAQMTAGTYASDDAGTGRGAVAKGSC